MIELNPAQQLQYAEKAMKIKTPDNDNGVAPSLLLNARREDDETVNGNRNLWLTYNVVQENIIRGGLEGSSTNTETNKTRKTKTRAIKSVQEDLRLNQGLWKLTSDQLLLAA